MKSRTPDRNTTGRLLKVGEVAERLGLSQRKVWALSSEGELTKVRIGASVRFDPCDVAALVERCRDEPAGGAA